MLESQANADRRAKLLNANAEMRKVSTQIHPLLAQCQRTHHTVSYHTISSHLVPCHTILHRTIPYNPTSFSSCFHPYACVSSLVARPMMYCTVSARFPHSRVWRNCADNAPLGELAPGHAALRNAGLFLPPGNGASVPKRCGPPAGGE